MTNLEIQYLDIAQLHFDSDNPRLPTELIGSSSSELAEYYYNNAVVSELVSSMLVGGFFPHEPIIVMPEVSEGGYKVVEGNRRLTALMIIHDRPEAKNLPRPTPPPTDEQKKALEKIPSVVSSDVQQIRRFIGYRHISGPQTWSAEAKARFQEQEVENAVAEGKANPFSYVASRVGTHAQSVRQAFSALGLLKIAQSESGFDVSSIQSQRFGVWLRLMSSPEFRQYIEFEPKTTDFSEVAAALARVSVEKLQEVLSDLKGSRQEPPILADSRNATDYGRVMMNPIARSTLRKTGDLKAAITIITKERLPDRINNVTRRIEALVAELQSLEPDPDVCHAADRLLKAAKNLQKLAQPDEEE